MKNNKGFTLVELLATIAILGIVSGIGIMAVSGILEKSRKQYYKSLKNTIEEAARSYYSDHRILLPVGKGDVKVVTAKELIDFNYLSSIKDHKKRNCNVDESKVTVTRLSVDNYKYEVEINCPQVSERYYK